jgi:hypothetical protein
VKEEKGWNHKEFELHFLKAKQICASELINL